LFPSFWPKEQHNATRTIVWMEWRPLEQLYSWSKSLYEPIRCCWHCKLHRWFLSFWQYLLFFINLDINRHEIFLNFWKRVKWQLPSDAHEKFPPSKRRALYFLLPPRVRTVWIRCGPILVFEAGLPNSNFLFLRGCGRFPPVARLLCQVSLEIPFLF
jgi:hypothetical protein